MSKKILIIYAHSNPKSFTGTILDTAVETLKAKNHEVVIRDLYAMKFNPVMTITDLDQFTGAKPPADVEEEQKHIKWCDIIFFIYPLWWSGAPAIAKGYIDRVFTYGFSYSIIDGKIEGLLNKGVVVFSPQGAPKETSEKEVWPAIEVVTKNYFFDVSALKCLGHFRFPSILVVSQEVRQEYLAEVKKFCSEL